ncbi:MAG: three-Cys-motif partner protein TcmP [Chloroflexi bacterium]|nr:three-Cys-motif partner protein TcmP [Chloroflexota bacterium]
MSASPRRDIIGRWTEIKLDIVRDYASAYSTILAAQRTPRLHHVYIDAFAGSGYHISRTTGSMVPGSPTNALLIAPPFKDYYFIDLDGERADALRAATVGNPTVHVMEGDCNRILIDDVFPFVRFERYRRGLCLLDPYGLDLDWQVVKAAGESKSIEIFINFPTMDMNRNVLWRNESGVSPEQAGRMTRFWGDESWHDAAYNAQQGSLWGDPASRRGRPEDIVTAYRERLIDIAGFVYVPAPIPMRNSTGAVVYWLFFASQNDTGGRIVSAIFCKHRDRGA